MSLKVVDKNIVYIGLGSNLAEPYRQIKKAIKALKNLAATEITKDSGYFKSRPMGPEDQPDYVNAVVEVVTELTAEALLRQCQLIEKHQGRVKKRHWGERTIDLDILLFDDQIIDTESLMVPHPGITERDFVYLPLLKINPSIYLPGKGLLAEIMGSEDMRDKDYGCQFVSDIT